MVNLCCTDLQLFDKSKQKCSIFHIPAEMHHAVGTPTTYKNISTVRQYLNEEKQHNSNERGWFIGDFEPSILKTSEFEVGFLHHKKGEIWPALYHQHMREINLLTKGAMRICGQEIVAGDIFVIEKNEIADPIFHEDCEIVCVKIPSIVGDKVEVL